MQTNSSNLIEVFNQYHLLTIVVAFAVIGVLSVIGMAIMFLFRIGEEVVTAYYKFKANCRAARNAYNQMTNEDQP